MASWSNRFHPGVIDDARRRQGLERRRIVVALASVAVATLVAYAVIGSGGTPSSRGLATGTSAHQSAPSPALTTAVGICIVPHHGGPLRISHHCVVATPAELLAPGIVTVASGVAPHDDPWLFSLQRLQADGLELLCNDQTPEGGGQCFPYPGQRNADLVGNPPLGGSPPVWLTGGGEGTCWPPYHWQLVAGLVMQPGLSVWFKTPTATSRIPLVRLDPRLGIPGGAFATIITRGPVTLLARDTTGRLVYTAPVTNRGDKQTYCSGLDGGWYSFPTQAAKWANLKPRVIKYPLGLWWPVTG